MNERQLNLLFESMDTLLEADAGLVDKDMFRKIEDDICRIFGIDHDIKVQVQLGNRAVEEVYREVTLDQAREETGDATLGTVPVKAGQRQRVDVDEDDENMDTTGEVPLAEYIRIFATGLLIYPRENGGMGIGNSQTARHRMNLISASGQKPRPKDPDNPAGAWLLPPAHPGELSEISIEMTKDPEQLPYDLKNYIALLSKAYLRGMIRICFEEFGLKSYIIHNCPVARQALARIISPKNPVKGEAKLDDNNPPVWNRSKMYHLAHNIIPRLVLRTMIAPISQTPNCNKSIIRQNADYLSIENLELLQDMLDPIDIQVDNNLELHGGKASTPLNYASLKRVVDIPDVDIEKLEHNALHNADGEENVYIPPAKAHDEGTQLPHAFGLTPKTHTTDTREYPAQKFGSWYVAKIDKSSDDNDPDTDESLARKGFISFDESSTKRFYFRGGETIDGAWDLGVGRWCLTDGMLNNYRNFSRGDCCYFMIHSKALEPQVLETRPDYHGLNKENGRGKSYDSSAFGIIVAGDNYTKDDDEIPGLVKPFCIEGRNDATYSGFQPGEDRAVVYNSELVPNGGKIPGLITIRSNEHTDLWRNHSRCINNTIFALALIGKWDPSIEVCDSTGHLHYDRLVALTKRWFPAGSNRSGASTDVTKMFKVPDLSEAGIILGRLAETETDSITDYVIEIDGVPWHPTTTGPTYVLLINADAESRLLGERDDLQPQEYSNKLDEVPALLFIQSFEGKKRPYIPLYSHPVPQSELQGLNLAKLFKKIAEKINTPLVPPKAPEEESLPVTTDAGTNEIKIFPPFKDSRGKTRRVGISRDAPVLWISGPETDNTPKMVGDIPMRDGADFDALLKSERATYVQTENGDINILSISGSLHVSYVRNGRIKEPLKVVNVFPGTTNALLERPGNAVDGKFTLGNLMGNPARLNNANANRYSGYVDNSDRIGMYTDAVGLDSVTCCSLLGEHEGKIGLTVQGNFEPANAVRGEPIVGTIDWYDADTLGFNVSTPVSLSMLDKNPGKLPRTLHYVNGKTAGTEADFEDFL